jgi:hypothetical protein
MIDPDLSRLIESAVERVFITMQQDAPTMAGEVRRWAKSLPRTDSASDYYKHVLGFPFLLIPWWVETSLGLQPDLSVQADLAYVSINGYYFIRMMDNIMDGHVSIERDIMPALAFFSAEWTATLMRSFPADHPFWTAYRQVWYRSAEFTVQDALAKDKTEAMFRAMSGRKVNAAKIPLLAICHLRQRPDLIETWSDFIDRFGMWHLFEEDLFDWHTDLSGGVNTYFLCEASRRKRPDEAIEAWVLREGFGWGIDTLDRWLPDVEQAARLLDCADVLQYLSMRVDTLKQRTDKLDAGMAALRKLITARDR